MSVTEHIGVMTNVDKNGNKVLLYPVTKAEAVDGLDVDVLDAFGEMKRRDTLTWDGDTTGLMVFDMMGNGQYTYYLMSEEVPTMEHLAGGVELELISPDGQDVEKVTLDDFFIHGNNLIVSQSVSSVLFVLEDNVVFYGSTIPKRGVYFLSSEAFGSVARLTIAGYTGFSSVVLKESNLPERYATKKQLIQLSEQVVKRTDVVDNLLSDSTDLPLSARAGKELNSKLTTFNISGQSIKNHYNSMKTGELCMAYGWAAPTDAPVQTAGYWTLLIGKPEAHYGFVYAIFSYVNVYFAKLDQDISTIDWLALK